LKAVFRDNSGAISMQQLADLEVQHYSIPNFDEFGAPAREEGATIASNKTLLRGGEILFSKLNCHKPRVWLVPHDDQVKVASTEFIPLAEWHSGSVDKAFITYLIGSAVFAEYMTCFQTSVTNSHRRINPNDLWQTHVPLPPLPEQQRIAAHLDAICAAIDAAVAAKRRQLETLGELRAEIIHRAVTVGLDPAVRLKPSGVEWFDKIPAHWKVDRLKDVVATNRDAIKVGPFGSDLLLGDMADEGIKVYTQRTVIDRDFDTGVHFISEEKYAAMKAFTIYPRDLLITTRGTIGRCAIVPETAQLGILHPCLMRVQTNKSRILPEYLAMLIQDCGLVLRQLHMMSAATTIDVIYSGSLKRTCLPVPPIREQQDIIAFIGQKDAELHCLVTQIESQIATLTAYRKSLIHECVTGQRRVTEGDLRRAGRAGSIRPVEDRP
jgi:type I restriction enzyme S subunit